jgi:hypothetical protein
VAEELRTPLYSLTPGELGGDPIHIERQLRNILKLAAKWNAVLLLDEAEVFLQQRDLTSLQRNAAVARMASPRRSLTGIGIS